LLVGVVALVPTLPPGCPATQPASNEAVPTERGRLSTTAEAAESATVGQTVALRAGITSPVDGGAVYYAWLQIAGPGVQITHADRAAASFEAPSLAETRTLRFMVTTTSEAGGAGRAEVSMQVAADPNYDPYADQGAGSFGGRPVAVAGTDRSVSGGREVVLDGSASKGVGLRYGWRQVSGPNVKLSATEAARVTFTAPQYKAGGTNRLEFELTVTGANNQAVTDRVRILVRDASASGKNMPLVWVSTTMGDFVIELYSEQAPLTVRNFLAYVEQGFYAGTLIHRVMPGFVIQGGGYLPGLTEKTPGNPIFNESDNGLKNVRGSVAMARTDDPNSARSQFFVNLADNAFLDYKPGEPGYAVFGQVVEGMDVVDQITGVDLKLNPNDPSEKQPSLPVKDIVIQSVTRVE